MIISQIMLLSLFTIVYYWSFIELIVVILRYHCIRIRMNIISEYPSHFHISYVRYRTCCMNFGTIVLLNCEFLHLVDLEFFSNFSCTCFCISQNLGVVGLVALVSVIIFNWPFWAFAFYDYMIDDNKNYSCFQLSLENFSRIVECRDWRAPRKPAVASSPKMQWFTSYT